MIPTENILISESAERDLKTLTKIRSGFDSWTAEYKLLCAIINERSAKALQEVETVDNGGVLQESQTTLVDRLYQELAEARKKNEQQANEILALQQLFVAAENKKGNS
jgi:hypothetical protein